MLYKELLKKTFRLLRYSREEWEEIVHKEETISKVRDNFIIPMAGLCALSAFIGVLFQAINFEKAIIEAIVSFAKAYGGVYFSYMLVQETSKLFGLERSKVRNMQLIGYSFGTIFVLDIITSLIPELFFLEIFKLYVFYIVWEGVEFCTAIKDEKRVGFVIFVSVVILCSTYIIEFFSNQFLPGAEIIAG